MNTPLSQDQSWLLKEKYHGEKTPGFFSDCERLVAGEPLAYVIGHIPFLNTTIMLDSRPLIPRSETEFWVEQAITAIQSTFPRKGLGTNLHILDLCAGSGCIGVAVGKAIPEAHVTFAELDPSHLPTIEKNCAANHTINETIVQSDLFENITGRFDYILSNPPYIDPALDRTEPSVTSFEPHLALYGGEAGSELLRKIIEEAAVHLNPQGELWLEHEPEQVALIKSLALTHLFSATIHRDQFGVERYSRLVLQ